MLHFFVRIRSLSFAWIHLLLAGSLGFLLVAAQRAWCIPPSVTFNGVATVLRHRKRGPQSSQGRDR